MGINRNNYEAYMLDYFEKELDPSSVAELMLFLEQNADLKDEFESFEILSILPDADVVFPDKNTLKKNVIFPTTDINRKNYEEYFIAAVENLLSQNEIAQLNSFLAVNPELLKDYSLFQHTKLQPDKTIIFGDKESLRRKAVVPFYRSQRKTLLYSAIALAASLLIFVSVYVNVTQPVKTVPLAVTKETGNTKKQESGAAGDLQSTITNKKTAKAIAGVKRDQQLSQPGLADSGEGLKSRILIEGIPDPGLLLASCCSSLQIDLSSTSINGSRTYFTDLYKYVRLREEIDYQQYLDEQERKPIFARTVNLVREKVFGWDCNDVQKSSADKSLWAIAAAGVKGINYLTNSNIEIRRKTDSDGNTTAYAIANSRFEYSHDLKK